MKNLRLFFAAFMLLSTLGVSAQQQSRQEVSVDDLLRMHGGAVEEFDNLIFRLEEAMAEKDHQSASVLLDGLVTRMNLQVAYNLDMARTEPDNAAWAQRHQLQNAILQRWKNFRFDFEDSRSNEQSTLLLQDLRKFSESIRQSISDIEAWLRRNH